MKASEILIVCLKPEVGCIFRTPAEENVNLMVSLVNSKIKFSLAWHEQGALFV